MTPSFSIVFLIVSPTIDVTPILFPPTSTIRYGAVAPLSGENSTTSAEVSGKVRSRYGSSPAPSSVAAGSRRSSAPKPTAP